MSSKIEEAERRVGSALESYPEDPSRLDDADLENGFAGLQRIVQAAEARKLKWLAEVQRRASFRRDGYLSATDWLSNRFNVARGSAKQELKTAEALEAAPDVREALQEGEVSSSAVRVLTAAWESHPEAFEASGSALLEAAKTRPIGDLRRTVEDWRHRQDKDDGLDQARKVHEGRRFDIAPTAAGTVGGAVELDPEGGECVMTAVQAYVDSEIKNGRMGLRTPRQLRADALVEFCRRYLDSGDRPSVGGERPHVTVTVDLQTLRGLNDGTAILDNAGSVVLETARRLSCDASVRRVVFDGSSDPLDVGRNTPVVPGAIRRAVIARDKTCRFPGCRRPPAWCDVHHIKHWADGGKPRSPTACCCAGAIIDSSTRKGSARRWLSTGWSSEDPMDR